MPAEAVKAAVATELERLASFAAYERIYREDIPIVEQVEGQQVVYLTTRWEISMTGGVVKARFVSREFRGGDSTVDFFAPATGGSTSRIILIYALFEGLWTFIFDASSAFLHVPEIEFVVVNPPQEYLDAEVAAGRRGDCLWRMRRTLYGRRGAAQAWTTWLSGELVDRCGLEKCPQSPTFFKDPKSSVRVDVHMDDGHGCGTKSDVEEFLVKLSRNVLIKIGGPYDPDHSTYCHLKRIIIRRPKQIIIKPNPAHIKAILETLGMEQCTPVTSPAPEAKTVEVEDMTPLDQYDYEAFRRCVGIGQYLAVDRTDIVYPVKELGRVAADPCAIHFVHLKRLARYLRGTEDYALVLNRRPGGRVGQVVTDANWAGCARTRKSTHCFCIFISGALAQSVARTQSLVAYSSPESEFYGAVSGIAEGLFVVSLFKFLGWDDLPCQLEVDASSAGAIVKREGLGQGRTIEIKTLWIQDRYKRGEFSCIKILGTHNPADLGTKFLKGDRIRFLMRKPGYARWDGDRLTDLPS